MSNKITATFGADVSEVEAKMIQATRATKAYERAVAAIDGKKVVSPDAIKGLGQANEQLAKGMTLLKGGAVGAGLTMVLGQMKTFSDYAEQLGDKATAAQKSAAEWGRELEDFSDTVKGWGASALGTLAQWGRDIGGLFRDPSDRAYDDVARASEKMAKRQEEALKKMKKAHEDAAKEIPKLRAALEAEKDETRLSALDEQGRAMTELYQTQKALAELDKQPKNAINEEKRLRLLIEQEKQQRKLKEIQDKILAEESEAEAKLAKEKEDIRKKEAQESEASIKAINEAARKQAEETANKRIAEEERVAEARKKAAAEAREKFGERLTQEGYTRGEDGRLRRGKAIISEEDAARTLAAKDRNAAHTADAKRGHIKGSDRGGAASGKSAEATLLEKIEAYLRPTEIK